MLNAFADSYLVRCFSAGYLRTPRRSLHLAAVADLAAHACAKVCYRTPTKNFTHSSPIQFMHTEEAYLGLFVSNPAGERWVVYGSERALEEAARDNLQRCVAAVQASVDEVYAAFTTKDIVAQNGYKAWIIAPVSVPYGKKRTLYPSSNAGTAYRRIYCVARTLEIAARIITPRTGRRNLQRSHAVRYGGMDSILNRRRSRPSATSRWRCPGYGMLVCTIKTAQAACWRVCAAQMAGSKAPISHPYGPPDIVHHSRSSTSTADAGCVEMTPPIE